MQRETDKLAMTWWGKRGGMDYDERGSPWTYGNRGCANGTGGCPTLLARILMLDENVSGSGGLFTRAPLFGFGLAQTPLLGAFLNSVSKAHDWLNEILTGIYDTNPASQTYGGARNFGLIGNTAIDAVSMTGMLPAAAFTARALYNNPLRVSR